MQSYLFIGGNYDGLDFPALDEPESVQLPKVGPGHYTYHRDILTVGDVSITFYRHEELTPEEVIDRLVKHYKAWAANRPLRRR